MRCVELRSKPSHIPEILQDSIICVWNQQSVRIGNRIHKKNSFPTMKEAFFCQPLHISQHVFYNLINTTTTNNKANWDFANSFWLVDIIII